MTSLSENSNRVEPSGLQGWLILPMINLAVAPIFAIVGVFQTIQEIRDQIGSGRLRFQNLSLEFYATMLGSVWFTVLLIATPWVLLSFVLKEKKFVPRLLVAYFVFLIVLSGIMLMPSLRMPDDPTGVRGGADLAKAILFAAIVIAHPHLALGATD